MQTLKNILFSTRLMAVLFITFAIAMAFGTFIESWYSTATARIWIYNAWWFEAIMVFFVINFIGNIARYRLLRKEKWAVLVLHLSWIFIILGAFVTRYISYEGMMPIREGASSNFFLSEKTYLTVFVDGEIDGELQRKTLQDDLLVTPEAIKSTLPWNDDFKGNPFRIEHVGYISGAEETLVADENGEEYLKIVEAGGGTRHDHFLKSGEVASIHNILFALNKPTDGAINITTTDSVYTITTPFAGTYMRMADQKQDSVQKDSVQPLMLRSLYNMANMQFVFPDKLVKGRFEVAEAVEKETAVQDALILNVSAGNETKQVKILGGKGTINEPFETTVGGLDFKIMYGSIRHELPFSLKLNDFIAEKYPGTEKGYSSFMSKITVEDPERPFDYDIYMNHILDHKGYRFFQAQFDPDEKGTILSVNHDFWGTWISYFGYFLLFTSMVAIMFYGNTRFKDLGKMLSKVRSKKAALAVLMLFGLTATAQENHEHSTMLPTQQQIDSVLQNTLVNEEHAKAFGELVIQDDGGRMKPVHTFTSELLRKLYKGNSYNNMNANQVMLSMMQSPAAWYNVNFIYITKKNDSIRKIIGVPADQKYVKATDFFDAKGNFKLSPYLQEAYATNTPNQFQKAFKEFDLKLGLLNRALSGEIFKIYPLLNDENNKWISRTDFSTGQYQVQDSLYANFIKNSLPFYLMTLRQSKATGNYDEANKILEAFKQNQKNYGAEILPSEKKIKAEILYNEVNIFEKLLMYYMTVGVLMFIVIIIQIFKDAKWARLVINFCKVALLLLFVTQTAGLAFRWYISGHAPWSDAYESVIYVAWATMAIGLLFYKKSDLTVAATAFVTSIILWGAHMNWLDPAIANLQPVLNSYWLMIHVAIIVGSYGPFTLGMILGVVGLILMVFTTKKNKKKMQLSLQEITIINELALTVGLVMLTIGNFLGGMWANESWGRYWGWDPKETWALISIMIYAFVLHMRLIPGLRGKWTFNFMSIAAYASIMMTYFGVNFYLVGLHSYASGDKVITPTFVYYAVAGVVVLGAVSYWRNKLHSK
jgi:cytochrome c-type biogenesis protein CcsB